MEDRGKTIAIIAHITLIGWIIAVILNANEKNTFASFYIRQMLGIFLMGIIGALIPVIQWIIGLVVLILLIMSLISAINGQKSPIPLVGHLFQDWFRGL